MGLDRLEGLGYSLTHRQTRALGSRKTAGAFFVFRKLPSGGNCYRMQVRRQSQYPHRKNKGGDLL